MSVLNAVVSIILSMAYVALSLWAFVIVFGWWVLIGMLTLGVINLLWWCGVFRQPTQLEQLVKDSERRENENA